MTEENKKVEDGQQDPSGDGKVYTQEELDAKLKEMQSNGEKGVQKLINEKKAYEKVFKHLGAVSDDPKKLVELYDSEPDVASIILDNYYEGKTIDEFKEWIDYKPDYNNPEEMQKLIDKQVENKMKARTIKEKKDAFIKHLKMEWKELERFEETFSELSSLTTFDVNKLDKTLEKAYKLSDADESALKEYKQTTAYAAVMWTTGEQTHTGGKKKKVWLESKDHALRKEVREFNAKFKTR